MGLAVVSMISGIIVDNGGFFILELFFMGWLSGNSIFNFNKKMIFKSIISNVIAVALIATVVIWLYDSNTKSNLNMTPFEREQRTTIM